MKNIAIIVTGIIYGIITGIIGLSFFDPVWWIIFYVIMVVVFLLPMERNKK